MKKFLLTIIFFIGLGVSVGLVPSLFSARVAHAAFNPEINYQGRLTNSSGVAVPNGNYNIQFNLYTVPSGGSSIWTETDCYSTNNGTSCTGSGTDQRVSVNGGLFSVMLGSTSPLTSVNFNQTLYLGVNIGGSATTPSYDGEMTPRKILGAVPAAMYAGTSTVALTLNGIGSGEYFRNDAANSTSSASTSLSVTQSGTGKIAEFFGTSSISVLSLLSNGNVGIGSSTPSSLLTVGGNAYFGGNVTATGTLTVTSTSTLTGLKLTNLANTILAVDANGNVIATTAGGGGSGTVNTGTTGQAAFYSSGGAAVSGTSTLFFSGGNIGIGTTTPGTLLTVAGNEYVSGNLRLSGELVDSTNSAGTNGYVLQSTGSGVTWVATSSLGISGGGGTPAGSTGQIQFNNGGSFAASTSLTWNNILGNLTSDYFTATSTTATSTFAGGLVAGNGALSVNTASGITTISALQTGPLNFDTDAGVVSWANLPLDASSGTSTAESFSAQIASVPILTVFGVANGSGGVTNTAVGIGSSTPSSTLSVTGTAGMNPFVVASSSGAQLLTLLQNGNFGIGTSTPAGTLDVYGNYIHFGTVASIDTAYCANGTNQCLTYSGNDNTSNGVSMEVQNENSGVNAYSFLGLQNNLTNTNGTSYAGLFLNSSGYSNTTFGTLANNPNLLGMVNTNGPILIDSATSTATSSITFAVNGMNTTTTAMTIISSGNVGIGSTTPGSRLVVGGNAYFGGNVTATGTLSVSATSTLTGEKLTNLASTILAVDANGNVIATTTSGGANFFTNSSATTSLSTGSILTATTGTFGTVNATSTTGTSTFSGAVGIGTSTPVATLAVKGTTGTNPFVVASSSGAEFLTVLANGNVGIGSSTPGSLLSVAGTALFTGAVTLNSTFSVAGQTTLATASSTGLTVTSTSTLTGIKLTNLASTFLAVDANGNVIATTTPILVNYLTNSAATTSLNTGTIFSATTGTFGNINATTTTATSTFLGFVGIGSSTPIASLAIKGSGIVTPFDVTASTGAQILFVSNANKVGIGTTTPAATFVVVGSACVAQGTGTTTCSATAGTISYKAAAVGNYDLAENYQTNDLSIVPGDIVAADPVTPLDIVKATGSSTVLGVISTDPGVLLGGSDGSVSSTSARAIALAGHVPVTVDTENGPIAIGDDIGLSSTPGIGMKSNGRSAIIGVALEPYSLPGQGTIEVFVNLHQYGDTSEFNSASSTDGLASATAATLSASSSSFVQTITSAVMNALQSAGNWIISKLTATLIVSNDVQTQTLEAETVTAQTAAVTDGLQMTDQGTGYVYCVRILYGEFAKSLGTCDNASSSADATYMGTSESVSQTQNTLGSGSSSDQTQTQTQTQTVIVTQPVSTTASTSTSESTSASDSSSTASIVASSTIETTTIDVGAITSSDVSSSSASSTPTVAATSTDDSTSPASSTVTLITTSIPSVEATDTSSSDDSSAGAASSSPAGN